MNKTFTIFLSGLIVTILISPLFFLSVKKLSIESEFSSNKKRNSYKVGFDQPDRAREFEVMITKDPKSNRVPEKRLIEAYAYAERLRSTINYKSNSIMTSTLDWTELGPKGVGGRTRVLMFDPNDQNNTKLWAGSVSGGLWYTPDITASSPIWYNVDDFWDNIAISSMDYDATDTQTFYVGTGEGWFNGDAVRGAGVWKTSDGGSSWERLSSTSNFGYIQKLKVHPTTGDVYIALRGKGIRRSTDGGSSWDEVLGRSTSGDNTNTGRAADIEFGADNTIYVSFGIFSNGEVWKSSTGDEGDWEKINNGSNGFPSNFLQRIELATAPSDANTLYAMVQDTTKSVKDLYKSNDKGENWSTITIPQTSNGDSIAGGQAWYNFILKVHPSKKNTVYAGGIQLFKTTDGGSTWTHISKGKPVHVDQHMITFKPDNSQYVVFGNDGGVYTSTDGGNTFENKNSSYNVTQFYDLAVDQNNPGYLLGGTQDNGTRRITTAGGSPAPDNRATGGDGAYCFIRQSNDNFQITSSQGIRYYRSTDGGNNFSWILNQGDDGGRFINPADYDEQADILYAAKDTASLWRLNNITGNITIDSLEFNMNKIPAHIKASPFSNNTLFVGTPWPPKLYKVENAHGSSPSVTTIDNGNLGDGYVSDIEFGDDEDHIIVTKSSYGVTSIYVTEDGGANWESREGNLPDIPVRDALFHPTDRTQVFLATEIGVWSTNNFDESWPSWRPSNNGLANVRTDAIKYRQGDSKIVAATHGRGFFEAHLPAYQYQNVSLLSSHYTPSIPRGIAKKGELVYIADWSNGLQIVDVSDTTEPENVASLELPSFSNDIAVQRSHAYIANDDKGLTVIDISDTDNLFITSELQLSGDEEKVTISGDYAYVSTDSRGVHIVDISDPSNPTKVSSISSSGGGKTRNVDISGNYAFIADGGNGMRVIDIQDKANPKEIGSFSASGDVSDVKIRGRYAYINVQGVGFKILDINDLSHPYEIGSITSGTFGYNNIELVGNYAYHGSDPIRIFDVSNPTRPLEVGYYSGSPFLTTDLVSNGNYIYTTVTNGLHVFRNDLIPSGTKWNMTFMGGYSNVPDIRDVEVVGNYAFVAENDHDLKVLDISNPQNVTLETKLNFSGFAKSIEIRGKYAYIAASNGDVRIIDISNPRKPVEVSSINFYTPSSAYELAFYKNYLLVAGRGAEELLIADISDPLNPSTVDFITLDGDVEDIAVDGDYAYAAIDREGMVTISLKNVPSSFNVTGKIDTDGFAKGIDARNDIVYIADRHYGIKIFDVSDKTDPQFIGIHPASGHVLNLEVRGRYLYAANRFDGVSVFDVEDPYNPNYVAYYNTPDRCDNLDVVGKTAYLANGEAGLYIVKNDLTLGGNSHNISKTQCISARGGALSVDVNSNYAYIASGYDGINVADISTPANAQIVGNLDLPGLTRDLTSFGTTVFTANAGEGIRIVDASNPNSPVEIGNYDTPGGAQGIHYNKGILAVADNSQGVSFIDVNNPSIPSKISEYKTDEFALDVIMKGQYAFVSDGDITVLDISNPAAPSKVTEIITPGNSRGLSVYQDHLYVADGTAGLTIMNIQNAQSPNIETTYGTGGIVEEVHANRKYAYLADAAKGIIVLNITYQNDPRETAFTATDARPYNVDVVGNEVYVANGSKGLCIYKNNSATPQEFDIEPNDVVLDISKGNILIEPINIINFTEFDLEFNLSVDTGGGDEDTTGVVGEWEVRYDWNCDESYNTVIITFMSDFSLTTSDGYSGGWAAFNNEIAFSLENGTAFYGEINGNTMSGTMVSDDFLEGCWTATLINGNKRIIAVNKSKFDIAANKTTAQKGNYTFTPNDDWVIVEPSGGNIAPNDSAEISLRVDASELTPGFYSAEVLFENSFEDYTVTVKTFVSDDNNVTSTLSANQDWNLISIPISMENMSVNSLFPDLASKVYEYSEGYYSPETLTNGKGYWVKFEESQTIEYEGTKLEGNIPVEEGWNIIGPFDEYVPISNITTEPEGIIASNFYAYEAGYYVAESLQPWFGYWVKTSEPGSIIINEKVPKSSQLVSNIKAEDDWSELTITDKTGNSKTLYLSDKKLNSLHYQLPPLPPANIFDVRFGDNTYAANISGMSKEIKINSAKAPYTLSVSGYDLKVTDNYGGDMINEILRAGEKITIDKKNLQSLKVSSVEIPDEYTLMQNYPNPFNPATTIKFGLPENAKVDLEIYNTLGQRVETIVSRDFKAGYHEVKFDGSNLASGVYLYRIKTDKFSNVKKMLLLK